MMLTRERIGVWLGEVHADSDLSPRTFRTAFALSQAADAQGFIGAGALAKVARADMADGATESFTDVLGRLSERGYLVACRNQRRIEGFRILVQAVRTKAKRAPKVVPFPAARRGPFIHKHAARMATLSQTKADAYLHQQLQVQAQTMRRRGIAEEVIAGEIKHLESAIRSELWKCILTPERPA
jgi:Family of unknown function (DUF6074)